MKKHLILYYSGTGNNRYLAERLAKTLNGDIEEIRPRLKGMFLLMLLSLLKMSPGIRKLKHKVTEYERVIVCSPVWMGQFISPLRGIIGKYKKQFNKFYFATCCGSTDAGKDEKFGYNKIFSIIKNKLGDKCVYCEAFPILLVVPEDKKNDGEAIMKTRLSDENFRGEILDRFNNFIKRLNS